MNFVYSHKDKYLDKLQQLILKIDYCLKAKTTFVTKIKTSLKKRMLFNKMRQYNIQMFNKIIFLKYKYRTRQINAIETNKLSSSLFPTFITLKTFGFFPDKRCYVTNFYG